MSRSAKARRMSMIAVLSSAMSMCIKSLLSYVDTKAACQYNAKCIENGSSLLSDSRAHYIISVSAKRRLDLTFSLFSRPVKNFKKVLDERNRME